MIRNLYLFLCRRLKKMSFWRIHFCHSPCMFRILIIFFCFLKLFFYFFFRSLFCRCLALIRFFLCRFFLAGTEEVPVLYIFIFFRFHIYFLFMGIFCFINTFTRLFITLIIFFFQFLHCQT